LEHTPRTSGIGAPTLSDGHQKTDIAKNPHQRGSLSCASVDLTLTTTFQSASVFKFMGTSKNSSCR